ncbi:MAG TPA: bifunctional diguanylate cyclase/phosphodiesterase, partial [Burkholderiaceae bacterium]|nr:bifunctional diguanylate cyclase/phosphodiesterase [Burkholderiaceae bacterium]
QVYGALTIAAPEPDAFDETELQLLKATAEDLEFGIGVLRSRSRVAAAEETVRRLAFVDAVTGLPNRVRLRELLAEAIDRASAQRRPLALLRIEIERFRELNETLGDVEMDKLLQGVARRLEGLLGSDGRITRIAEDEFAVVLPGFGAEAAADVGRRLASALAEPIELHELLLDTRSAVGIAFFPGHGAEADALMRRASIALDQAKRSGSGVSMFREGQDRERQQRLSLIGDLRRAVVRDELRLYCQPQMHLATGRICGAEALVRWNHPRLGMINPGEFIKLAESGGIITPLTYWVLDAALRQRYEWQQQGIDQTLSVNLSAHDLREPKLIEHISDALETWGARPGWIGIELTESALMEDPAGALETLQRLKRHDVRLAVDDFGTGYSSLAYLQQLPVDEIKIDQSFVSSMITNADSQTIVRSTIDLAHNLNLQVVAEGVEDQRTFERLAELGCDRAQGYCISRPIPAAEFGDWQARH